MGGREVKRSGTMLARAVLADMVGKIGGLKMESTTSSPAWAEASAEEGWRRVLP
jgi:hypothetical protein